jgi:streptogramin lyase
MSTEADGFEFSQAAITLTPRSIAGFNMPDALVQGPAGAFLFTAKEGLGILPPIGPAKLIPTPAPAFALTPGLGGEFWFLMPKRAEIGRLAPNGTLLPSIPCPGGLRPVAITETSGVLHVELIGTGGVLRFTSPTPVKLPLTDAMSIVYDSTDSLLWWGAETGLRSVGANGGSGPVIPIAGAAVTQMAYDPSRQRLWYFDEGRAKIGLVRNRAIVAEHDVSRETRPTRLTIAPDGKLWFALDGGPRLACSDGNVFREYAVSGIANPQLIDVVFTTDGRIVCLDRWNFVIGIGSAPRA